MGDMLTTIRSTGGDLVDNAALFDIYRGKQIPENKKSTAFSITFRAADRTLTVNEVDKLMEKIMSEVTSSFKGSVRG